MANDLQNGLESLGETNNEKLKKRYSINIACIIMTEKYSDILRHLNNQHPITGLSVDTFLQYIGEDLKNRARAGHKDICIADDSIPCFFSKIKPLLHNQHHQEDNIADLLNDWLVRNSSLLAKKHGLYHRYHYLSRD